MKKFERPVYELVKFGGSIITSSSCSCFFEEIGFDLIKNETCTGANISCSCSPNYDDPSQNCEDPS